MYVHIHATILCVVYVYIYVYIYMHLCIYIYTMCVCTCVTRDVEEIYIYHPWGQWSHPAEVWAWIHGRGRLAVLICVHQRWYHQGSSALEKWKKTSINGNSIGLIYGRYLQLRFLKWPKTSMMFENADINGCHHQWLDSWHWMWETMVSIRLGIHCPAKQG